METVFIRVKNAGSLQVQALSAKEVYSQVKTALDNAQFQVTEIRRGPKKKAVTAE